MRKELTRSGRSIANRRRGLKSWNTFQKRVRSQAEARIREHDREIVLREAGGRDAEQVSVLTDGWIVERAWADKTAGLDFKEFYYEIKDWTAMREFRNPRVAPAQIAFGIVDGWTLSAALTEILRSGAVIYTLKASYRLAAGKGKQ